MMARRSALIALGDSTERAAHSNNTNLDRPVNGVSEAVNLTRREAQGWW